MKHTRSKSKHTTLMNTLLPVLLTVGISTAVQAKTSLSLELGSYQPETTFQESVTANGNSYGTNTFKDDGSDQLGLVLRKSIGSFKVGLGVHQRSTYFHSDLTTQALSDEATNNADIVTNQAIVDNAGSTSAQINQAEADITALKSANTNITNGFKRSERSNNVMVLVEYDIGFKPYGWQPTVGARAYKSIGTSNYLSGSVVPVATFAMSKAGFSLGAQGNSDGAGFLGSFSKTF